MNPAQAASAAAETLPAWAQVALAAFGLATMLVGAWQSNRAARHGRRAADAAADVANRTRTNHGTDHIGSKVDDLVDGLSALAERTEHGHRILEHLADEFVTMRGRLDEHVATPHTKPRARNAAAAPVDLREVEKALKPPASRRKPQG